MNKLYSTMFILLIAILAVGCSSENDNSNLNARKISPSELSLKKMPRFQLTYLDGTPFDSKSLEGKVLFVDFWATWCGPCLHEIPAMIEMGRKYKKDGFEVVGITVQSGSPEDIQPTVERLDMDYHVLLGNNQTMNDFGGIYAFPTNFLITKNGNIYKDYIGVYPKKAENVEMEVRYLLGLDDKQEDETS